MVKRLNIHTKSLYYDCEEGQFPKTRVPKHREAVLTILKREIAVLSCNASSSFEELHLLRNNQYKEEPSWFLVGQCFECLLMHFHAFKRPHPSSKEMCSFRQRGQYLIVR